MKHKIILSSKQQRTINHSFKITGVSPLSGHSVEVCFYPAKANTGIKFKYKKNFINANYKNITKTTLNTTVLTNNKIKIHFTEHVLSAVYGLKIDNLTIELKKEPILPLLDGSSLEYYKHFKKIGLHRQNKKVCIIKIIKPMEMVSDTPEQSCQILPDKNFKIKASIEFDNLIGKQEFNLNLNIKDAYQKIAGARTFFQKPYSRAYYLSLRQKIKSLPPNPALSPVVAYTNKNFIQKQRYPNEQIRHKILDMVGDLSLSGYRLQGKFIFHRPSHAFTAQIIKKILKK